MMKRMWRGLIIIFFCITMTLSDRNVIRLNACIIPDPHPVENLLHNEFANDDRGTWYLGATPNEGNSNHPVVFVQGLQGKASDWWRGIEYYGVNDMYRIAYNSGYRTAFVQLLDKKKGPLTQWENGKLLAQMLERISAHFGGEKVNIVAHSKGGVDTQVAVTHYNAHRFVDKIITIASPHHGSHLANLLYSWYGKWLSSVVGARGKGTYELQTGNMEHFRRAMDLHPNIVKNTYYTASGTSWGPMPSILWCGGLYLSQYGENDGLVIEKSTRLPYAKHLFKEAGFDHALLQKGSAIWDKIEPVLNEGEPVNIYEPLLRTLSRAWASTHIENPPTSAVPKENDQFISGGELIEGEVQEKEIFVDRSEQALFTIYSKWNDLDVSLRSPSGVLYRKDSGQYMSSEGVGVFSGSLVQSFRILAPEVGKWKVQLKSAHKDAYLVTTSFIGNHSYSVNLPSVVKEEGAPLQIQVSEAEKVNSDMNVDLKIIGPDQRQETRQLKITKSVKDVVLQDQKQQRELLTVSQLGKSKFLRGAIHLGKKRGLYNVVFIIKKKTGREVVERMVSRSVYVNK